jgi:hypothetical protein
MSEIARPQTEEILAGLRRIEGVLFAGQLGPVGLAASCSCQNCGCDSRAGDNCGCNPRCSCQGHTAADRLDWALDPALGVATVLPLDDIKTLVQLREKLTEGIRKRTGK